MKFIYQKFTKILGILVYGGIERNKHSKNHRRIAVMNILTLIGIANLIPLGYVAYRSGDYGVCILDYCLAAVKTREEKARRLLDSLTIRDRHRRLIKESLLTLFRHSEKIAGENGIDWRA